MVSRPGLGDLVTMAKALKQGSVIEAPVSLAAVVREVASADTARDSPLTLRQVMRHPEYRDLSTAKVALGDEAVDFELPRYDFSSGAGAQTGETVRLSQYRDLQPVALIFGSYT
jgi:hypothetical protein